MNEVTRLFMEDMKSDIDLDTLDMDFGSLIDSVDKGDSDELDVGDIDVDDLDLDDYGIDDLLEGSLDSDYPEDDEEEEELDTYHLENFNDKYLEVDPLPRIIE